MSHADPTAAPARALRERGVAGLVVYTCTVATIRLAKDADKAPAMPVRLELLRMSAGQVESIDRVVAGSAARGVDALGSAEAFVGALGAFDERLRPLDWYERILKTYLALGLLTDVGLGLVERLDAPARELLTPALSQDRFAAFAAAQLADTQDDAQLTARLGLWGRRVVGEEIGTMAQILAASPGLLEGQEHRQDLQEALTGGAVRRMKGLGLRM